MIGPKPSAVVTSPSPRGTRRSGGPQQYRPDRRRQERQTRRQQERPHRREARLHLLAPLHRQRMHIAPRLAVRALDVLEERRLRFVPAPYPGGPQDHLLAIPMQPSPEGKIAAP